MAFIVFEGLDGSGKTTLIQKLNSELQAQSIASFVSREPGGTPLGEELRTILLRSNGDTPCPKSELLIYEAIRAQHVEKKIRPSLEKGWVLCDRFIASSIAFQAAGRNIQLKDVIALNEFATSGLKPDLTVLLDISVQVSEVRKEKRVQETDIEQDRFEKEKADFHEKVRQNYLEQAKNDSSWLVLDGTQTPETLFETLISELKKRDWLN